MKKLLASISLLTVLTAPAWAQDEFKSAILKHLKTSRDFTLKVAEAMPADDYSFKLTPPQMSFGGQLVHLSRGFEEFLSPFGNQKPEMGKPASDSKADVIAFVKASFDHAIETVSKLTPQQIGKPFKAGEFSGNGYDLLLGMLDHVTHHRASAEMYLRAKGIKPPEYDF